MIGATGGGTIRWVVLPFVATIALVG